MCSFKIRAGLAKVPHAFGLVSRDRRWFGNVACFVAVVAEVCATPRHCARIVGQMWARCEQLLGAPREPEVVWWGCVVLRTSVCESRTRRAQLEGRLLASLI